MRKGAKTLRPFEVLDFFFPGFYFIKYKLLLPVCDRRRFMESRSGRKSREVLTHLLYEYSRTINEEWELGPVC